MCAIYQLCFRDMDEIRAIADRLTARYGREIAEKCFDRDFFPKNEGPVIGPGQKVGLLTWGFRMKGTAEVVFNARAESLRRKPMFRDSLRNRCLVPATAFYEWDGEKRKYRIARTGPSPIYLAALWKGYRNADGSREFRFCIITTAPNASVGKIHNRMPAVIRPEDIPVWFGGTDAALRLLRPPEEPFSVHPV